MADSLEPSVLGTKEHWDDVYNRDLTNYLDFGDTGEIWFGEDAAMKMTSWVETNIDDLSTPIVDLGCGNGHLLFDLAEEYNYTCLTGLDYSPPSIQLCQTIADSKSLSISFQVFDILNPSPEHSNKYKLALDKGTYDAISLAERADDNLDISKHYPNSVYKMLQNDGILLITSCNWTDEELVERFKEKFEVFGRVKYPTFKFGGVEGQQIVTIAFKKKSL
ncbi:Methyltransferase-like protein 10 [Nowakowskiella sp. JEL0407]|nr:Methyltransferase-like protein 10 [Nowakowskiella sp. JEL0407]